MSDTLPEQTRAHPWALDEKSARARSRTSADPLARPPGRSLSTRFPPFDENSSAAGTDPSTAAAPIKSPVLSGRASTDSKDPRHRRYQSVEAFVLAGIVTPRTQVSPTAPEPTRAEPLNATGPTDARNPPLGGPCFIPVQNRSTAGDFISRRLFNGFSA